MKKAFVTGGSGFLGGALIRRLVAEGVAVTALARSEGSADIVAKLGATPCLGGLGDEAEISAGMLGCDTVFHAAAHFTDWDPYELFYKANVVGTEVLLRAAARAGVVAFVAAGASGSVMGAPAPLRHIDETAPLQEPTWAPYTATKAIAERMILAANTTRLRTVVINPPLIWGPAMPMLDEMLPLIQSGKFALPDGGTHMVSTSYVDNVVEAMLLAAEKGRGGQSYFVTDGDDISFAQVVNDLLATRGLPPTDKSAPFAVAWPMAAVLETVWRVFRLKGQPPITRQMLRMIGKEFTLDISKAKAELGYVPVVSRAEGLARMEGAQ
ncbi:NAD-dependent epimerase/dehydratase family protein [Luteibacter aegosomaticola]|uniref:NAD-dependent epimerase/dehydratase family protein n=1 Tax=Luteibacter aegosomaticola TaxID=2911538 RepID=UPI001FF70DE6|nr:NAD-dependent epimerase/dehydratase family protein [Luteibacter aegosomaticola]UPG89438.1 NAD-dependent epimerase/dehydratase family protein [Luteibacter aegosomaticola]